MNIYFADDDIVRIILTLTEAAWSYNPSQTLPTEGGEATQRTKGEEKGEREERRRRPIRQSWRMQRAGGELRGGKERTILSS